MKAVIWTDVFQSVIILGGLIAVCIVVRPSELLARYHVLKC